MKTLKSKLDNFIEWKMGISLLNPISYIFAFPIIAAVIISFVGFFIYYIQFIIDGWYVIQFSYIRAFQIWQGFTSGYVQRYYDFVTNPSAILLGISLISLHVLYIFVSKRGGKVAMIILLSFIVFLLSLPLLYWLFVVLPYIQANFQENYWNIDRIGNLIDHFRFIGIDNIITPDNHIIVFIVYLGLLLALFITSLILIGRQRIGLSQLIKAWLIIIIVIPLLLAILKNFLPILISLLILTAVLAMINLFVKGALVKVFRDASGRIIGKLNSAGNKVVDDSGRTVQHIEGDKVIDTSGEIIGKLNFSGNKVVDGRGKTIQRVEEKYE